MAITEERRKRVIDLYYNQGKTTREIAKIERMSIRDISTIFKLEEIFTWLASRRVANDRDPTLEEIYKIEYSDPWINQNYLYYGFFRN